MVIPGTVKTNVVFQTFSNNKKYDRIRWGIKVQMVFKIYSFPTFMTSLYQPGQCAVKPPSSRVQQQTGPPRKVVPNIPPTTEQTTAQGMMHPHVWQVW